jgi:hypothetical protein
MVGGPNKIEANVTMVAMKGKKAHILPEVFTVALLPQAQGYFLNYAFTAS